MMTTRLHILPAASVHTEGWRVLWDQYCGGAITQQISDATWVRILDLANPIGSVVALLEDQVVGLLTYVEHECTWETKSVCYVEDVFVGKRHRGPVLGVGHALAGHLVHRLRAGEWARVYGITRVDNILAQRLYNHYTQGEPYLRYLMKGNPC